MSTHYTRPFGEAQPYSRLALELLSGPGCTTVRSSAAPYDSDADGLPDSLRVSWPVVDGTVDEICVRVRPRDPLVRTGYSLSMK